MTPPTGVSPTVATLLALQALDADLYALEQDARDLTPRLAALDAAQDDLSRQLARSRQVAESEGRRSAELTARLGAAKAELSARQAALDAAERLADVTVASARVEEQKRAVALVDADAAAAHRRAADAEAATGRLTARLEAMAAEQGDERARIAEALADAERALAPRRAARARATDGVPGALLAAYDRVRRRRPGDAIVAARGAACSACDTALPVQRVRQMVATMAIEVCEGCGVLLFATG